MKEVCFKCKGELNETPVKFNGKYWCNWHIPAKYFDPRYEHLIDEEQFNKNIKELNK